MENLVVACNMLVDPEDHKQLVEIIKEHQPELIDPTQKMIIITTDLRAETLNSIRTFIKGALRKHGLDYPE
jgi:hypothetical protein